MQNHSPRSYFQILHDDFIIGNMVSREHRQFHRVFWTFGQCKEAFKYYMTILSLGIRLVANTVSFIEFFGLLANVKRFSSTVSQSYKLTAHICTANTVGPS